MTDLNLERQKQFMLFLQIYLFSHLTNLIQTITPILNIININTKSVLFYSRVQINLYQKVNSPLFEYISKKLIKNLKFKKTKKVMVLGEIQK